MEDIISENYIDLACVYCAKRWFVPRRKYNQFKTKLYKNIQHKDNRPKFIINNAVSS